MLLEISHHYQTLIDDLQNDWTVELKDLNNAPFEIDTDSNTIFIHSYGLHHNRLMQSDYFRPQFLLNMVEALRMAKQTESLEDIIHRYQPNQIMLLARVCAADAITQKISFAWDAKLEDDNSLWKYLLCSDISDVALAFATSLEKLLTTGHDIDNAYQKSMVAGFNQWFASQDRQKQCDYDTLNMMDDMIADNVIFRTQSLDKNIILFVSSLIGEQKTYLDDDFIEDVLNNPYYASCHDEINQIHFMQIINEMNKINVGGLVFQDPNLAARFTIH